jgi:hypothetical protein
MSLSLLEAKKNGHTPPCLSRLVTGKVRPSRQMALITLSAPDHAYLKSNATPWYDMHAMQVHILPLCEVAL